MEKFIIGASSSFIIFLLSLEIRKDMGNVWYRYDSSNKRKINIRSLLSFLSKPFNTSFFWSLRFIDLNWIVVSGIGGLLNLYFHNINLFSKL